MVPPEWGIRHGAPGRAQSFGVDSGGSTSCNWLQAMEGGIDSSHVKQLSAPRDLNSILYSSVGARGKTVLQPGAGRKTPLRSRRRNRLRSGPGVYIGARRNAENGDYY
jgi:hypothetical protein